MKKLNTGKEPINVILVYFSILENENKERNKKIENEIERLMEETSGKFMVIGDFNGHIEDLGYQKQDERGKMIIRWMNEYNLNLLNIDEKCRGVSTWERGNQKSTIDFVLVNNDLYSNITSMKIDENKVKELGEVGKKAGGCKWFIS